MSTEVRDRMTETFIAVGDALRRSVVPTFQVEMRKTPDYPRPWYLPEVPVQTPAQYAGSLARLSKLGIVKRAN